MQPCLLLINMQGKRLHRNRLSVRQLWEREKGSILVPCYGPILAEVVASADPKLLHGPVFRLRGRGPQPTAQLPPTFQNWCTCRISSRYSGSGGPPCVDTSTLDLLSSTSPHRKLRLAESRSATVGARRYRTCLEIEESYLCFKQLCLERW